MFKILKIRLVVWLPGDKGHTLVSDLSCDILIFCSQCTHFHQRQDKLQPSNGLQAREDRRTRRCTQTAHNFCLKFLEFFFNTFLLSQFLLTLDGSISSVLILTYSVCLQGGFSMFIQLMPIVVLILVSLLSQMMVSPPPYSLYSRPYVYTLCHY